MPCLDSQSDWDQPLPTTEYNHNTNYENPTRHAPPRRRQTQNVEVPVGASSPPKRQKAFVSNSNCRHTYRQTTSQTLHSINDVTLLSNIPRNEVDTDEQWDRPRFGRSQRDFDFGNTLNYLNPHDPPNANGFDVGVPSIDFASIPFRKLWDLNLNSIDSLSMIVNLNLNSTGTSCSSGGLNKLPSTSVSASVREAREAEKAKNKQLVTSPVDEDGNTELHLRIRENDEIGAMRIIGKATDFDDLNTANKFGQTPIHFAVLACQAKIARKLMSAGAEVSVRDNNGNSPLHLACQIGYLDIVRPLVTPIRYEETKGNGYTIPFCAIPQNMSTKNGDGYTCRDLAFVNGHDEVVELLEEVDY